MSADDTPHPLGWLASLAIFVETLHGNFDNSVTSVHTVDALIAELELTWSHPHLRSGELATSDGVCPTWWDASSSTYAYAGNTAWYDLKTWRCSLDVRHAAPHVNLDSGLVRLGHEPRLQHIRPTTVLRHVQRDLSLAGPFRGYHMFISSEWWKHLARTHDCHACYLCPREVW